MRHKLVVLFAAIAFPCGAQTMPTAGQYYPPGTTIPTSAQGVEQVGIDSITSLRCMVGETTTCQVPTTSSGGGGGGTSSSFAAAFPATGTAIGVKSGANMVNLTADGSSNLNVNCAAGCVGGTFNNNADAVATSSTNGQAASWLYGFNGTTWDRLRDDVNKLLSVNLGDVGGAAIALGSTTSSASLPVVIASDQGAVAVKQATAANLNATVVGTGTFVTQSTVTQATASSLNATVVGSGIAGTPAGGVLSVQGVSGGTNLNVNIAASGASNISTNLAQVNGVTVLTGTGATGTGSQRTTVAQDTTTLAGSAPGTAGTPSTNVVSVQGVVSGTALPVSLSGNQAVNMAQVGGTNTLTGGVAGSQGVGGLAANNASTSGNPVPTSGLAESAEPTLATNGQNAELALDLAHKLLVLPFSNPENFVTSTLTITASTSDTSFIPSAGTGLVSYITSLACFNSGATATLVDLKNGSGGTVFWKGYALNGGGGFTISFPTPIGGKALSTATAVYLTSESSTSSLVCSASSYKGS